VTGSRGEGARLAEPGHAGVDEVRVTDEDLVRAETEAFHDTGPEALDEDVGCGEQPVDHLSGAGMLEVDLDRAPVPSDPDVGAHARVARRTGPIDADDIRSQVRQQHHPVRRRAEGRDLDHADARERPARHASTGYRHGMEDRERRGRTILPLVLAGGVVSALAVTGLALLLGPSGRAPEPRDVPPTSQERQATDAEGSDHTRGHRFWGMAADGGPLRWDPCTPIEVVLSEERAPSGARVDLELALDTLAAATGLTLTLLGTTDERPSVERPLVVRDGGTWQYAPVLVAWSRVGDGGLPLTIADRGISLPVAVRADGREAFVTGQVVLNADRTDLVPGFGDRRDAWGATLLHELAHLLGLAHVDDPTELMSTDPGDGPVRLGPGDLEGLARLGVEGGCNPAPDPGSARLLGASAGVTTQRLSDR